MSLKPIKKALQLKPPRTRSRTEMSCPEAGVSQGPDEIAESEAEAISMEVNETRSPGNDTKIKWEELNQKLILNSNPFLLIFPWG